MNKLNEEQYRAATANIGQNLIIASAGTGKTSTIVARIEHLLNLGIKPNEIMLLTFTNKAAREMITRLEKKLGKNSIKGIISGTFHSISLEFLKKNKNIQLKKTNELRILLKSIYEKYNPKTDDLYDYSYLAQIYSMFNNTCLNDDFHGYLCDNYEGQIHNSDFYCKVLSEYEEQKKSHNYYDFDDLLLQALTFFKNEFQGCFYEVLVDEYQDTNNLQSAILDAIPKKSLFCVGDYDQSIYAFNGANIEIIGSFKDRYKNAQIYSLNKNYRSLSNILEFANRVITKNERLYPKELIVTRKEETTPIKLHSFNFSSEQYEFIANEISEKIKQNPKEEIAVIYRNNSSGDGIERFLKIKGLKIARKGGSSFYDLKEVNSLINLANLTNKFSDILSFIDILLQTKGVGNAKVNNIYKAFLELGKGCLIDGILRPIKKDNYNFLSKNDEKFGLFANSINEKKQNNNFNYLKTDFKFNPILLLDGLNAENIMFLEELYIFLKENEKISDAYTLIKNAFHSKIFELIINNIAMQRSFKGAKIISEIKEQKIENIKNNCKYILDDSKKFNNFKDFYEHTILNIEYENQKGVQLLTVHASKGLEFNIVYLIDLAQGRFPNLKLSKSAGGIDEERRLFYVALTRAKNELIMSWAKKQNDDDKNDAIRSIFIDEGKKN
ncbi:ATP-dependent helicase [Campylobacter sp. MG1]|uniref:ATP-dependent helicase n=1 Tax=Campylobacter sp. MG1 TaxID=2976332 RepID=UPI00226CC737|nr:ATP-dependent helicase [Campylobacter sp. MG1]